MTLPDARFPHLFTLSDFIHKFAPPNENQTAAYLAYVAGCLDVDESHPFHLVDVDELAEAIAHMEGWYAVTKDGKPNLPQRNNSPGDLLYARQNGAVRADERGYAMFATPAAGWKALKAQIALDQRRSKQNWEARMEAMQETPVPVGDPPPSTEPPVKITDPPPPPTPDPEKP